MINIKNIFLVFLAFSNSAFSESWAGKYLSETKKNILIINNVDVQEQMFLFEIKDFATLIPKASFLSIYEKDLATTKTLEEDTDCQLKFKKSDTEILVSDLCKSDENLSGRYLKL